jgi:hypothetical protein
VVGGPVDAPECDRLFDAWATAEGGFARWNALNTTYKLHGSTDYNSAGVQNYERPTEGVCALALTLVNGLYPGILEAVQRSHEPAEVVVRANAAEFDRWGTGARAILKVLAADAA